MVAFCQLLCHDDGDDDYSHFSLMRVCDQPPTAAVNATLLAFAALRRRCCCWAPAAISRYLPPARHLAANAPHAAVGGTDRQTDGHPVVT